MYRRHSAIASGAALLILFAPAVARGSSDGSEAPQAGQPVQAASRLQVTGSRASFSIEADHADVQSTLKAVFVQANKQFDMDSSVGGQVTLKLENQPLDTVLSSLCRQTFLKYSLDGVTGIYHFQQDSDAVKAAFAHIDTLNNMLRQQLRNFGLDLPADAQLDGALSKANLSVNNQFANGADRNAVRSGGPANQSGQKLDAGSKSASPGLPEAQINNQNGVAAKSSRGAVPPLGSAGGAGGAGGFKERELDTGNLPDYLVEQLLQASGLSANQQSAVTIDKALGDYLRKNNLVEINTHGAAVPVSDVFAELSRQSGTAIMLEPTVPRGPRFRITLSLPACSLTEALNLILPPARLRWRTINNTIFITPSPEFQIFYGSAPVPYVIYGYNGAGNRSQQNSQQNATLNNGLNGGQGASQAPTQNSNPK